VLRRTLEAQSTQLATADRALADLAHISQSLATVDAIALAKQAAQRSVDVIAADVTEQYQHLLLAIEGMKASKAEASGLATLINQREQDAQQIEQLHVRQAQLSSAESVAAVEQTCASLQDELLRLERSCAPAEHVARLAHRTEEFGAKLEVLSKQGDSLKEMQSGLASAASMAVIVQDYEVLQEAVKMLEASKAATSDLTIAHQATAQLERQVAVLESEITLLNGQQASLSSSAAVVAISEDVVSLQGTCEQLRACMATAEEMQAVQKVVGALEGSLQDCQSANEHLQERQGTLAARLDVEGITDRCQASEDALAGLEAAMARAPEVAALQDLTHELEDKVQELEASGLRLEQSQATLSSKDAVSAVVLDCTGLRAALAELAHRTCPVTDVASLETSLKQLSADVKQLQEDGHRQEEHREKQLADTRLSHLMSASSALAEAVMQLQSTTAASSALDALDARVSEVSGALEHAHTDAVQLREEMRMGVAAARTLEKVLQDLECVQGSLTSLQKSGASKEEVSSCHDAARLQCIVSC
jgi:hypothetical protein